MNSLAITLIVIAIAVLSNYLGFRRGRSLGVKVGKFETYVKANEKLKEMNIPMEFCRVEEKGQVAIALSLDRKLDQFCKETEF